MKQRSILLCAALLAAAVSCNTDEEGIVLSTPVLSIADTTSTSFTVAWEAVENADMYTYEFGEDQASTEELSVTFDGLVPDSMYTVKVKAVSTSASVESEWAEISVTLLSQDSEIPKLNLVAEMTDRFTLNVRTSPTDKELPYYFEPVPGSMYEDAGNEPEAVFRFPAPCMRMPAMSRRQCCRICWLHICNITVMRQQPMPSLQ